MKWIVCSVLIFLGTSFFAADENKDHNYSPGLSKRSSGDTESGKDYVGYSDESNFNNFDREKSNTYKMSVSPPSGGTFIPESTCSGEVTKDEANLVEGKKIYSKNSIPTATYIISMSGQVSFGGGAGGSPATWGAYVRNKYFWIDTPQGKILTIPVGNNASATSHYPSDSSYEKSTWKIKNSSGTSNLAEIDKPVSSISGKTIWSYQTMFSGSTFNGFPAGKYIVEGTSEKDTSKKDTVTWEVVQGDFYKKTSLAFDDYTDFNPQDKYYSGNSLIGKNNRGRAQTVYVVKKTGIDASVTLNLIPSPIAKDVSVGKYVTKQTTSYTISGAGTVNAKLGPSILCRAIFYEYPVENRNVLTVSIKSSKDDTAPAVNWGNTTTVFDQMCITYRQRNLSWTYVPASGVWSQTERMNLVKAFTEACAKTTPVIDLSSYKHVIFFLKGKFDDDKIGYGQMPGKYCWILSDFNHSNNASCVPHEMLHNYGCDHTPADQLNIMHPTPGTKTVIRQPQWIKVR